jgi:hypothetical protein
MSIFPARKALALSDTVGVRSAFIKRFCLPAQRLCLCSEFALGGEHALSGYEEDQR